MVKEELLKYKALGMFRDIVDKGDYLLVTCPFHNEGKERTPSMGVTSTKIVKGGKVVEEGHAHCFGCGYSARYSKFLADTRGCSEVEVIKELNKDKLFIRDRDFNLNLKSEKNDVEEEKNKELSEKAVMYLKGRGLEVEVLEKFKVYDKDGIIYFPMLDKRGKYVGKQGRGINKKSFFNDSKLDKFNFLYGLYEVLNLGDVEKVVVVESIIDCLTCWSGGVPSVALCGSILGDYHLRELSKLRCSIILALDNDEVGKKGNEEILSKLIKCGVSDVKVFPWGNRGCKDINELGIEKLKKMIK